MDQRFWNQCFDKGRLKNFVLWFFINYGEHKTVKLLENLKNIGFEFATKAGISLGIDDLKIPPKKTLLMAEAEKLTMTTVNQYKRGEITGVERFQRLIDTWHRTSESLKQEVIEHFQTTDILNPVYMMAFSGARGNISQVRQLVGMRGLMADPQGKILDFPIRSNFREGLTLTEYIISCYGARKGIVDTALRTANAGYLTRRLVDVAQHVIVAHFDCGTKRGIVLTDMKEGNKTIYSLANRLVGRVLAQDVHSVASNGCKQSFGFRNQEISLTKAIDLAKNQQRIFVRSPLTCESKQVICQLCYGWSLAQGNIVSIGEAVGIIAAQSIGEPGTQLTMRTFHTGGVFSGDITEQIKAPFDGIATYPRSIPGTLIRTSEGKISFLTKSDGIIKVETKVYKIPSFTVLFVRNGEKVFFKQVIAQISNISRNQFKKNDAELCINAEIDGEVFFSGLKMTEFLSVLKKGDELTGSQGHNGLRSSGGHHHNKRATPSGYGSAIKTNEQVRAVDKKAIEVKNFFIANEKLEKEIKDALKKGAEGPKKIDDWTSGYVLSGQIYKSPIHANFFPKHGDFIGKTKINMQKGILNGIKWSNPKGYFACLKYQNEKQTLFFGTKKTNIVFSPYGTKGTNPCMGKKPVGSQVHPELRSCNTTVVVASKNAIPLGLQQNSTRTNFYGTVVAPVSAIPGRRNSAQGPTGIRDSFSFLHRNKEPILFWPLLSLKIQSFRYKKNGYFFKSLTKDLFFTRTSFFSSNSSSNINHLINLSQYMEKIYKINQKKEKFLKKDPKLVQQQKKSDEDALQNREDSFNHTLLDNMSSRTVTLGRYKEIFAGSPAIPRPTVRDRTAKGKTASDQKFLFSNKQSVSPIAQNSRSHFVYGFAEWFPINLQTKSGGLLFYPVDFLFEKKSGHILQTKDQDRLLRSSSTDPSFFRDLTVSSKILRKDKLKNSMSSKTFLTQTSPFWIPERFFKMTNKIGKNIWVYGRSIQISNNQIILINRQGHKKHEKKMKTIPELPSFKISEENFSKFFDKNKIELQNGIQVIDKSFLNIGLLNAESQSLLLRFCSGSLAVMARSLQQDGTLLATAINATPARLWPMPLQANFIMSRSELLASLDARTTEIFDSHIALFRECKNIEIMHYKINFKTSTSTIVVASKDANRLISKTPTLHDPGVRQTGVLSKSYEVQEDSAQLYALQLSEHNCVNFSNSNNRSTELQSLSPISDECTTEKSKTNVMLFLSTGLRNLWLRNKELISPNIFSAIEDKTTQQIKNRIQDGFGLVGLSLVLANGTSGAQASTTPERSSEGRSLASKNANHARTNSWSLSEQRGIFGADQKRSIENKLHKFFRRTITTKIKKKTSWCYVNSSEFHFDCFDQKKNKIFKTTSEGKNFNLQSDPILPDWMVSFSKDSKKLPVVVGSYGQDHYNSAEPTTTRSSINTFFFNFRNFQEIFQHKKLLFPGKTFFDDIKFDKNILYIECKSLSINNKSSKLTLANKLHSNSSYGRYHYNNNGMVGVGGIAIAENVPSFCNGLAITAREPEQKCNNNYVNRNWSSQIDSQPTVARDSRIFYQKTGFRSENLKQFSYLFRKKIKWYKNEKCRFEPLGNFVGKMPNMAQAAMANLFITHGDCHTHEEVRAVTQKKPLISKHCFKNIFVFDPVIEYTKENSYKKFIKILLPKHSKQPFESFLNYRKYHTTRTNFCIGQPGLSQKILRSPCGLRSTVGVVQEKTKMQSQTLFNRNFPEPKGGQGHSRFRNLAYGKKMRNKFGCATHELVRARGKNIIDHCSESKIKLNSKFNTVYHLYHQHDPEWLVVARATTDHAKSKNCAVHILHAFFDKKRSASDKKNSSSQVLQNNKKKKFRLEQINEKIKTMLGNSVFSKDSSFSTKIQRSNSRPVKTFQKSLEKKFPKIFLRNFVPNEFCSKKKFLLYFKKKNKQNLLAFFHLYKKSDNEYKLFSFLEHERMLRKIIFMKFNYDIVVQKPSGLWSDFSIDSVIQPVGLRPRKLSYRKPESSWIPYPVQGVMHDTRGSSNFVAPDMNHNKKNGICSKSYSIFCLKSFNLNIFFLSDFSLDISTLIVNNSIFPQSSLRNFWDKVQPIRKTVPSIVVGSNPGWDHKKPQPLEKRGTGTSTAQVRDFEENHPKITNAASYGSKILVDLKRNFKSEIVIFRLNRIQIILPCEQIQASSAHLIGGVAQIFPRFCINFYLQGPEFCFSFKPQNSKSFVFSKKIESYALSNFIQKEKLKNSLESAQFVPQKSLMNTKFRTFLNIKKDPNKFVRFYNEVALARTCFSSPFEGEILKITKTDCLILTKTDQISFYHKINSMEQSILKTVSNKITLVEQSSEELCYDQTKIEKFFTLTKYFRKKYLSFTSKKKSFQLSSESKEKTIETPKQTQAVFLSPTKIYSKTIGFLIGRPKKEYNIQRSSALRKSTAVLHSQVLSEQSSGSSTEFNVDPTVGINNDIRQLFLSDRSLVEAQVPQQYNNTTPSEATTPSSYGSALLHLLPTTKDSVPECNLGDFLVYGDILKNNHNVGLRIPGQVIHLSQNKITLRRIQPIFMSPNAILHSFNGDFVNKKTPLMTLPFQVLTTGDIVQGIPKIEQLFEARTTKNGRFFKESIPNLLIALFQRYKIRLPLDQAVRQSFYKIQQIIIDGVQRVYRSQGVTIADKHIEIIVKQMTSKVLVVKSGQTGFLPGEILDLEFVEKINESLIKKIRYEPIILGITKASLEVNSFLSAASFQQTTKVLSKSAITKKRDFLKGLKENVIVGNLIPAGTGIMK